MGVHSFRKQGAAQPVAPAAQPGVDGALAHAERCGDLPAGFKQVIFAQKNIAVGRFHRGDKRADKILRAGGHPVKFGQVSDRIGKTVVKREGVLPAQRAVAVDAGVAGGHGEPGAQRGVFPRQRRGLPPQRDKDVGDGFLGFAWGRAAGCARSPP